jgi:hypothetical protein
MQRYRLPGPGRWGTHPIHTSVQLLANLTVNATSTLQLGGTNSRSWIAAVVMSVLTVPVDSDGTILATLKKWDASAGAAVTLSSALDCEALTAKVVSAFAILSTLSDDQRTLDVGDTLYVEFVSNSAAIDTQPVGLVVHPELWVLK